MKLLTSIDDLPRDTPMAVTLGIFDGVHGGHQRVLQQTVRAAGETGSRSVVITFDPHPAAVLRGEPPPLVCAPEERLARIAHSGIHITVVQPFDRVFASQSAEEFLRRLAGGRQLRAILMTAESAFGRDRAGTLSEVRRLASSLGFAVVEVDQLQLGGETVSSSRIREQLANGRLARVRRLLGRPYAVIGEIVHGDGRGRELGYPTANFGFDVPVALPPDGIYAVRVSWGGEDLLRPARRADGVASLGVRPMFAGDRRILEAFLFDIDEELYGVRMRLEFVRRQRGEKRFSSVDELIHQMDLDSERARRILGNRTPVLDSARIVEGQTK